MKVPARDLNFLPADLLAAREKRQKLRMMSPLIAAGALLVILVFAWQPVMAWYYQNQIDEEQLKLAQLQGAEGYYKQLTDLKALNIQYNQAIGSMKGTCVDVAALMDEIASVLPDNVELTSLEVDAGWGVTLKFETDSALKTAQFVLGLRSLNRFQQVEPNTVPLREGTAEIELELPFAGVTSERVVAAAEDAVASTGDTVKAQQGAPIVMQQTPADTVQLDTAAQPAAQPAAGSQPQGAPAPAAGQSAEKGGNPSAGSTGQPQ
ncbi:MAG: PilN domain-containing protein [Solirubrobacterales bacterium]